jgi:hypothetical protein
MTSSESSDTAQGGELFRAVHGLCIPLAGWAQASFIGREDVLSWARQVHMAGPTRGPHHSWKAHRAVAVGPEKRCRPRQRCWKGLTQFV